MRTRTAHEIPEALRRHNEEQRRDPEEIVSNLGRRVQVVVLWRQRDDDPERWICLEQRLGPRASAGEVHYAGGVLDLAGVSTHTSPSRSATPAEARRLMTHWLQLPCRDSTGACPAESRPVVA